MKRPPPWSTCPHNARTYVVCGECAEAVHRQLDAAVRALVVAADGFRQLGMTAADQSLQDLLKELEE